MAGSIRCRPGGILAVLDLLEAGHGPALEADLLTHGLPALSKVGSPDLPWHALFIFARRMNETPGSALAVAEHGTSRQWSPTEQMLNGISNMMQWLIWSKSKDASQPGAKPPTPIYLPGLEPVDETVKHRGTPTPLAEVLEMLGDQAKDMYSALATG